MRQIYNIESPPSRTADSSPNTTPTGNDGFLAKTIFKCPMTSSIEPKSDLIDQKTIGIDMVAWGTQITPSKCNDGSNGDYFKCLATTRLSLANLLPSRLDKCGH